MHDEVTGVEQWGKIVPVVLKQCLTRGQISRTRGLIHPRVETVVFVVRDTQI